MLFFVFLSSCVKEANKIEGPVSDKTLKTGSDFSLPIYMGQNTMIGEAYIYILNDQIVCEVSLLDGYTPDAAHFYAGETAPPTSAPGQFPYHWYPGDPFPVMFTVDISDWYECQEFDWYFALHFEIGNETAWILPEEGGLYWLNKKGKPTGWGQYFHWTFGSCEIPT